MRPPQTGVFGGVQQMRPPQTGVLGGVQQRRPPQTGILWERFYYESMRGVLGGSENDRSRPGGTAGWNRPVPVASPVDSSLSPLLQHKLFFFNRRCQRCCKADLFYKMMKSDANGCTDSESQLVILSFHPRERSKCGKNWLTYKGRRGTNEVKRNSLQ
jgi:hypothetical protein